MELRHVRYFIAVAEQLNFRKAAEILRVSQPPLSAQIQDLEKELGAQLLNRSNRKVSLTAEGRVFLQHAYEVMERIDAARSAVVRVGRGEEGELRIGFTQSSEFLAFLAGTIHRFRNLHPKITLSLQEVSSQAQIEAVLDRRLDLGIARMPKGRNPAPVRFTQLYLDRLVLAVHASDPLATRRHVEIRELRNANFILHRPDHPSGLYRRVIDLCKDEGYAPVVTQEAKEVTTCIALVASGLGVAVVPSSMQCIKVPNVSYLPIIGLAADIPLFMISLREDPSHICSLFTRMLLESVADAGPDIVHKERPR